MIEFKNYSDIPNDFTGVCKTIDANNIYYYKNGLSHNEFGPAFIYKSGTKYWYINGKEHREDGPSTEYSDGGKRWYYKDKYYGYDNDFTVETWIEKVIELKREEQLEIFK